MYVKAVKLINFRNYENIDIKFDNQLNFLVGDNAQGKTNILEAIYLCSTGKSYRTANDKELIKWHKNTCFIGVNILKNQGESSIKIAINNKKGKKIKVNDFLIERHSDLFGNLNVVMFSPEDLKLIKEGPSERRRFIDDELFQLKPRYYQLMLEYKRALYQRNTLLKDIKLNKRLLHTLPVWNEKIIELGSQIMFERRLFIKKLSFKSRLIHRKITDGQEELKILYRPDVKFNEGESLQIIKRRFEEKIQDNLQKDINFQTTTAGPHRDDMQFFVNDIDMRKFGSQGQQRTVALALKVSELELIRSEIGEYPILLLDDVMSELDYKRQKFLMNTLKNVQTIITSTDKTIGESFYGDRPKIFTVINGSIKHKK